MKRWLTWMWLGLLGSMLIPQGVMAQAGRSLQIRVRDLQDQGVGGLTFVLHIGEHTEEVVTNANGIAVAGSIPAMQVIIEQARKETQSLIMDSNRAAGGLSIALPTQGPLLVDFRLSENILFIEPVTLTTALPSDVVAAVPATRVSPSGSPQTLTATPILLVAQPMPAPQQEAHGLSIWTWIIALICLSLFVGWSGLWVWRIWRYQRQRRRTAKKS